MNNRILLFAIGAALGLAILNSCGGSKTEDLAGTSASSASEKNFATLINQYQKGRLTPTPWAGYWWPYKSNGVAAGGFSDRSSPAGKYDAARGLVRRDATSAQGWEISYHGPKSPPGTPPVQDWWGHCNGWSVSSALFPEPRKNVVVNGITFSPTDIKALLTEAGLNAAIDFYGSRVDWAKDFDSPKAYDVVPNQFFLLLTNYIGKKNYPILIDRHTLHEVWNQPLIAYEMTYPTPADYAGADPNAPDIYRIKTTVKIWWVEDNITHDSHVTDQFNYTSLTSDNGIIYTTARQLTMELWLDAPVVFDSNGKIKSSGDIVLTRSGEFFVGGTWKAVADGDGNETWTEGQGLHGELWPDFAWVPHSVIKSEIPTGPAKEEFEPDANPYIDIEWIKAHLLVPGGADDPAFTPGTPEPAPEPEPVPSTRPSPRPTDRLQGGDEE